MKEMLNLVANRGPVHHYFEPNYASLHRDVLGSLLDGLEKCERKIPVQKDDWDKPTSKHNDVVSQKIILEQKNDTVGQQYTIPVLQKRINTLESEKFNLVTKLNENSKTLETMQITHAEHFQDAKKQSRKLETELLDKQKEIDSLERKNRSLAAEISQTEKRNEFLTNTNGVNQRRVYNLSEHVNTDGRIIVDQKDEIRMLNELLNSVEKEVAMYKRHEDVNTKDRLKLVMELSTYKKSNGKKDITIKSLGTMLDSVNVNIEDICKQHNGKINDMNTQIATLQRELQNSNDELQNMHKRHAEVKIMLDKTKVNLSDTDMRHDEQLNALNTEIATLKGELHNSNTECKIGNQEIERLNCDNRTLRHSHDDELQNMHKKHTKVTLHMQEQIQSYKSSETKHSENLEQMRSKFEKLVFQKSLIEDELNKTKVSLTRSLQEKDNTIKSQTENIKKLEGRLGSLQVRIKQSTHASNNEQNRQLEQKQMETNHLNIHISESEKRCSQLEKRVTQFSEKEKKLKGIIKERDTVINERDAVINKLRLNYDKNLSQKQCEICLLTTNLAERDKKLLRENESLKEKFNLAKDLELRCNEMANTVEEKERNATILSDQVESLERELETMKEMQLSIPRNYKEQLQQTQLQLKKTERQLQQTASERDNLLLTIKTFEQKETSHIEENKSIFSENIKLTEEVEKIRVDCKKFSNKAKKAEKEVCELNKSSEVSNKLHGESKTIKGELTILKLANKEIREKLDSCTHHNTQLMDECKGLQIKCDFLNSELKKAQKEQISEQTRFNMLLEKNDEDLRSLKQEKVSTKQEIDKQVQDSLKHVRRKHEIEMDKIKTDITKEQKDKVAEKSKLLSKKEKELTKIRTQMAEHENESTELHCKVETMNNEKITLENDLMKLNQENNSLKKQNKSFSADLKAAERASIDKNKKMQELSIKHDSVLTELQKEIQTLNKEKTVLRNDSIKSGEEQELMKKQNKRATIEKDKKIQELSNRLASEMSTKISSDERSLENVSVKNRPMNIASEYEMICSNEWHDAKGALDECPQISEEDRIKLLCLIFESSEIEATSHLNMAMAHIQSIISHPLEDLPTVSKLPLSKKSLPEQMKVFLGDCLRNNADIADIKKIVQKIKEQSRKKCPQVSTSVFEHSNFVRFLEASGRLAWKMVLQRPPMHFERKGLGEKWQGENKQEPFWSSSDPKDPLSRVKYYVHPALYHGESLMVKGRVYLSKS